MTNKGVNAGNGLQCKPADLSEDKGYCTQKLDAQRWHNWPFSVAKNEVFSRWYISVSTYCCVLPSEWPLFNPPVGWLAAQGGGTLLYMQPDSKKITEIIEEVKLLIELPLGVAFQKSSISFREMHGRHFSENNPRRAQHHCLDSIWYYPNCTTYRTTLCLCLHGYI